MEHTGPPVDHMWSDEDDTRPPGRVDDHPATRHTISVTHPTTNHEHPADKETEQEMDNTSGPRGLPVPSLELGGLTTRQWLFVEAYLGEAKGNATEAAMLAGYHGVRNTLRSIGQETLRNPDVASRIKARLNEVGMSTTAILYELENVARAPTGHFMIQTQGEVYDADGKKLRDAQVRLDYGAKIRALELLMRFHRMLDERAPVEVTVKALVGVDINRI